MASDRLAAAAANINPEQIAVQLFSRAKTFFLDLKAKIAGDQNITFEEAVQVLKVELNYPEHRAMQFVRRFDHNNDGQLSLAEFNTLRRKITETKSQLVPKFREYDADGDGYITLEEASNILLHPPFSFPPSRVTFLLRNFDRDGNGRLDIEEFAAFYAEAKATNDDIASCFDRLDTDGNGVLTPDEVASILQERLGFDLETAKNTVDMFDQNKDGSLDKAEFMQLWTSMFGQ